MTTIFNGVFFAAAASFIYTLLGVHGVVICLGFVLGVLVERFNERKV